jgi:hypothetical protein
MQSFNNSVFFESFLKPWYAGLQNPKETQEKTLEQLLEIYSQTRYGKNYGANTVTGFKDYQNKFPKLSYNNLEKILEVVKGGDYQAFLSEPPHQWVMTRGSTGSPKILPATALHLTEILTCGARAFLNYLRQNTHVKAKKVLNLSLPSRVATINTENGAISYGYSSGTYSRIFPSLGSTMLIPTQKEIDNLGPDITKKGWENRFELVYQRALQEDIFATIGVAPVIISFARFVTKTYGKRPRDIWDLNVVFSTSVRKIQTRYKPLFRKYYGDVSTVEIYSATEGVFAQQLDKLPYVSPNYDRYLFEVETGQGTKMLHELERGEWGRLIVSTCMFPRYDICDMIEAMGKQYFRVFGRAKWSHILEHQLFRAVYRWFF